MSSSSPDLSIWDATQRERLVCICPTLTSRSAALGAAVPTLQSRSCWTIWRSTLQEEGTGVVSFNEALLFLPLPEESVRTHASKKV